MKAGEFPDSSHTYEAKIDMAGQHQHAGPGLPSANFPHPWDAAVHLPHVHLRAPHRGRAGAESPTASPRWNLKTSARSTTGCWSVCAKAACSRPYRRGSNEFARLNLTYVITSKRKLAQLVNERKSAAGTTRACPPSSACAAAATRPGHPAVCRTHRRDQERLWIDYSTLDGCLREDLENKAHRGMAVLDPVKLVLTNWAEVFGSDGYTEDCTQPALPHSTIAEGHDAAA